MLERKLLAFAISLSLVFTGIFCAPPVIYADDYDDDYYDDYDDDYDDDSSYGYQYIDQSCHYYYGYGEGSYESHDWDDNWVIQKATPTSSGKKGWECFWCHGTTTTTFPWRLGPPDSEYYKSYNVLSHTYVYPNSKSITLKLHNPVRGSVVKVKIGKRTYTAKVGTKKKIKLKISKPKKYGQRISINVYYKGKRIGRCYWYDSDDGEWCLEDDEIVYSGWNIKKKLTKKAVKCLVMWGSPSRTASGSGGWSYWYYDDGSYIGFKNGRVKYWYDAAG